MADGLNQVRAMRISELMTDYRNLHQYIAAIRANPSNGEYDEEGFVVLRRCIAEAQALLQQPFQSSTGTNGTPEQTKLHLQRIIIDAAGRRFRAQRIYLQATAALRWVNSRATVLQGQRPQAGHTPALQQVHNTLRAELASVTDQRVELSLRTADTAAGKWLVEDPGLPVLQRLARGGNGIGR